MDGLAAAPRTIVVGYDGSEPARRGMLRAAALAGKGSTLVVVTTTQSAVTGGLGEELLDHPPEEASELLAEAEELLRPAGVSVSMIAEEGDPAETLVRAARETGADLIVVGARGRSFVARTLLGSVVTKVVEAAPCDVLVAR